MKLRNLTPHPVHVLDEHDVVVMTVPAENVPLRLPERVSDRLDVVVDGRTIEVVRVDYDLPAELPDMEPGTLLIVSRMVVDACPERWDLVSPYPVVRDGTGQIVGCRGFAL